MENSAYQNPDNSLYSSNFWTNSKCAMNWSNNCSNPFSSQTIESRFDSLHYNPFNDSFLCSQTESSKNVSSLNPMCDNYRDHMLGSNSRYSSLQSPNHMRIWTDNTDQSKSTDTKSWGIMFPMQMASNADTKTNWDYGLSDLNLQHGNSEELCEQPLQSYNKSLEEHFSRLQNFEDTFSNLKIDDKKTWALIVGRKEKVSSSIPNSSTKIGAKECIVPGISSIPLDVSPKKARFFVIKSYSEDDVYRSIKYQIWCSTENGNRKLDSAYRQSGSEMPIYLLFSVNGSGHFCGVAEMVGPVDYKRRAGVWAQGKWKGQFDVRWLLVKDVPNSQLRHIRIETNENKPVTNSRDATEVPLERGRQVLKIVTAFKATSSIYDDFDHYEQREKSEMSSLS